MAHERILIVDDDNAILALCRTILEMAGYRVGQARNGEEALERFQNEPFDVLLTDIRMPGMTGLEIVKRLHERNPDLTCVAMTAYSTMDTAIQAMSLGIDEFIVKPFGPDALRLSVARALEKARLRRENASLRALYPLFETAQMLMGSLDREELARQVVLAAARVAHAENAALWVERGAPELELAAQEGPQAGAAPKYIPGALAPSLEGAAQGRAGVSYIEAGPGIELARLLQAQDVLHAPLIARGARIGLLAVWHADAAQSFASGDIEAMTILAGQAATALENSRLFSDLTTAYRDLQQLDRLKSEFINIASHELRTPLSLLMGYAVLLEEENNPRQSYALHMIVDNAERLRRIVDDLLNLRYLERGYVELHQEEFPVREAIESVQEAYKSLAEAKTQRILIRLDETTSSLRADRSLFDLILGNLLSNAIKFTPAGGGIEIGAHGDVEQVTICVGDSGPGIAEENLERIFHRFYQVESSLTRQHGGLGLGLAIAREMVLAQGGRIWVESAPGEGSRFFFTLPRRFDAQSETVHMPGIRTEKP